MIPIAAAARRWLEQHLATLHRSPAFPLHEAAETRAALTRIDRGVYGRCESCGGAIGRQRLLALPATRYCIACAPPR